MPTVIYERRAGEDLPKDYVDGMWDELEEFDSLSTDWGADGEDPPLGFWHGTHTRDGKRVRGFTEPEYIRGEECGDIALDDNGEPIYADVEKWI